MTMTTRICNRSEAAERYDDFLFFGGRKQDVHQGGVAFVNKAAFKVPLPFVAWGDMRHVR